jgi:hypothetical protein
MRIAKETEQIPNMPFDEFVAELIAEGLLEPNWQELVEQERKAELATIKSDYKEFNSMEELLADLEQGG